MKTTLETGYGNTIFYHNNYIKKSEEDILEFLSDIDYMHTFEFAKNTIMPEEIQANNSIEGLTDDLSTIGDCVKRGVKSDIKPRIKNLYKGYKFILTHKNINKDSLKELYAIVSKDLLDEQSKANMGQYYRNKPVYILKGNRLDVEPYLGMDADKIDYYMNNLFDYINTDDTNSEIENFIKSQVIHFYFVFIHPYFDINGRCSRTLSMWYLLNHETYPYIILNRAIAFAKKEYENKIIAGRSRGDITLFLDYMLKATQKELEKEYVINNIRKNIGTLSKEDAQILEYFISMNGDLNLKNLVSIYNSYNISKRPIDLIESRIDPLIEDGILINMGDTKNYITSDRHNSVIALNDDLIDVNRDKLKYLKLEKYTK